MSITATTMKCPICPDQFLETISAPIGDFEQCPHCSGLFIRKELIAAASQDRTSCHAALDETKALLLATDKWCPKCLQKLSDGRVRSRGIIVTLCATCEALWTSLPLLRSFEEVIEKSFRTQIEIVTAKMSGSLGASQKNATAAPAQDTVVGNVFRSTARFLDWSADKLSRSPALPNAKAKETKPAKPTKKIQKVEPVLPEKTVTPEPRRPAVESKPPTNESTQAPSIDVPDFIFPEEPMSLPEPVQEPVPIAEPVIIKAREPVPPPSPEPVPQPHVPELKPEPTPDPKLEPQPMPIPVPPALPEPVLAKTIAPPIIKKPAPRPTSDRPGFFSKFKSAWSPTPKKSSTFIPVQKPAAPKDVKPVEVKKPPLPKPIPTPVFKVAKPKGEGFFSKLLKPAPRKVVIKPTPVASTPAPTPTPTPPLVQTVNPVPSVPPTPKAEPVLAQVKNSLAPVKVDKPVKPKPVKAPKGPRDHVALWTPWVLMGAGAFSSSFRDFGFEVGPATLWGIMGWSIGQMVRLSRQYPFKPFEEKALKYLLEASTVLSPKPVPVILQGQLIASSEKPGSELVFQQEERTITLNRLSPWDMVPRLFGLSNPRQLLKGDVTLRGWFRGGLEPFVEIQDVRSGKTTRKSLVRALRWTSAVFIFLVVLVISLSLE